MIPLRSYRNAYAHGLPRIVTALLLAALPAAFQLNLATALIGAPLMAYLPAVALARYLAGRAAGLFVALAGTVVVGSLVFSPPWSFTLGHTFQGYQLLIMYIAGAAIIMLVFEDMPISTSRAAPGSMGARLGGAISQNLSRPLHAFKTQTEHAPGQGMGHGLLSGGPPPAPPRIADYSMRYVLDGWVQKNLSVGRRQLRLYRRGAIPAEALAAAGVEERYTIMRNIHRIAGSLPLDEKPPSEVLEQLALDILSEAGGNRIMFEMAMAWSFHPSREQAATCYLIVAETLWELALAIPHGGAIRMEIADDGEATSIAMGIITKPGEDSARTHFIKATSSTIIGKLAREIGADYRRTAEHERVLRLPLIT